MMAEIKYTENILASDLQNYVLRHRSNGHDFFQVCPGCKQDVMKIAITKLVYVHEPCDCELSVYRHLVEQLWHRECFLSANK